MPRNPADRPATEPRCNYGAGWPSVVPCQLPDGHRGKHEWMRAVSAGADPEPHQLLDGYCPTCNGGCLVGFGNPPDEERCSVEGCDELPEDHRHPACNDSRHDEIEAWYRQVLEARAQGGPSVIDVERLGTAMHNIGVTLCDNGGPGTNLDDVAAEYARLSRPSDERVPEEPKP